MRIAYCSHHRDVSSRKKGEAFVNHFQEKFQAMSVSTAQSFSIKTRKPVDEDALLTEEDRAEKVADKEAEGDCSTRRRACKNCVCGRAEVEKQMEAQGIKLDDVAPSGPPAGGCGNCSRGDAFRCAGCPYLGKPAWNADAATGKVQLNLTDDI